MWPSHGVCSNLDHALFCCSYLRSTYVVIGMVTNLFPTLAMSDTPLKFTGGEPRCHVVMNISFPNIFRLFISFSRVDLWCDRRPFVNGTYILTGLNVPDCDQIIDVDAPGHFVHDSYFVSEQRTNLQLHGSIGPLTPPVDQCQCRRGGDGDGEKNVRFDMR